MHSGEMGRWKGGNVGSWGVGRGSGEGREVEGRGAKVLHTFRHTYIHTDIQNRPSDEAGWRVALAPKNIVFYGVLHIKYYLQTI